MKLPVTVVIPCYKCSETIDRTLDSVASQTLKPSEVLLVEDCSGDQTYDYLLTLPEKYDFPIRVISLKVNSGPASARNVGWNHATQKYVAFLDADDTWPEYKLEYQIKYLEENPDVVLCGNRCDFVPIEEKSAGNSQADEKVVSALSLLFRNAFSTPTIVLRRNSDFRFEEGAKFAEDLYLWQRMAFSGAKLVTMQKVLAISHKPLFGAGGLSENLLKMELGELSNLLKLWKSGNIGFILFFLASIFSIIKFFKRLLLVKFK